MQKYFISEEEFKNEVLIEHAHHISNVMRMKQGDEIIISSNGVPYIVNLVEISSTKCTFKVVSQIDEYTELPVNVDLIQGYAKGDKMELIIQKATELGVSNIYPIVMKRSIVKIEASKQLSKIERFNKIALEASRQSHRNVVSKILNVFDLKRIDFSQYDHIIVAYEEDAHNNESSNFKRVISNLKPNESVLLVVGPEGGIATEEIEYLKNKGAITCAIGPRILRTETAALYMLSAISYEMELK